MNDKEISAQIVKLLDKINELETSLAALLEKEAIPFQAHKLIINSVEGLGLAWDQLYEALSHIDADAVVEV